jgi:hypothetical protein
MHDIKFTRPTEIDMYVEIDVSVDATAFGGGIQAAGILQIQEAIVAIGDDLAIGDDVVINKLLCAAFDVTGVIDVAAIKIEDTFPPTNTANIPIATRELARFATARVTVNVI